MRTLASTAGRAVIACLALPLFAAQPPATLVPHVRHIIGLSDIKSNQSGSLSVQDRALLFDAGNTLAQIAIPSIDDIYLGTEVTQAGGKTARVVKTAAIAAPYESGKVLTLLLRTKVDILTVVYHDDSGGLHSAILAVPKGQAAGVRMQLIAAGARHDSVAAETGPQAAIPAPPGTPAAPQKLTASAIQIDPIEAGDIMIPAEFRYAMYERLIQRVRADGEFQKVLRAGDREAADIPDLVVLRTTISRFKQGSQTQRELTTVTGGTRVDVTATVQRKGGGVLLNNSITGHVRFFGENLGVTNDLAKRIAKLLRENF